MKTIATKAEAVLAIREALDAGETKVSILPSKAHATTSTRKKNQQSPFANLNSGRNIEYPNFNVKRIYDEDGNGWWVDASDPRIAEWRATTRKPAGAPNKKYQRHTNANKTPERSIRTVSTHDITYDIDYQTYNVNQSFIAKLKKWMNK